MTHRSSLLAIGAALSAVTLLAACGGGSSGAAGAAGGTTKVTFGYIGDFNGSSLLAVADQEGLWKKHHLDVSTKVFTNGPLQIQALGAGDLDFGYIGPGAMWLPASGKAKVVALNTLGNADRVIAQAGITSLADLRGKKIGIPAGTSGDMILTLALESVGLTKDDVSIVPMDPATIVTAFASKKIDAAGIWYPLLNSIKARVPDLVELGKDSDFSSVMPFPTAFVAGNDVVKDHEQTVTEVLGVLKEAMKYRSDHPQDAIKATAGFLKLKEADVAADAANSQVLSADELDSKTADGTIDTWLGQMNDYFVKAGTITGTPQDPSDYYTGDLFKAAK
jgi:NitT/TauT family transport system substrate-binding protein